MNRLLRFSRSVLLGAARPLCASFVCGGVRRDQAGHGDRHGRQDRLDQPPHPFLRGRQRRRGRRHAVEVRRLPAQHARPPGMEARRHDETGRRRHRVRLARPNRSEPRRLARGHALRTAASSLPGRRPAPAVSSHVPTHLRHAVARRRARQRARCGASRADRSTRTDRAEASRPRRGSQSTARRRRQARSLGHLDHRRASAPDRRSRRPAPSVRPTPPPDDSLLRAPSRHRTSRRPKPDARPTWPAAASTTRWRAAFCRACRASPRVRCPSRSSRCAARSSCCTRRIMPSASSRRTDGRIRTTSSRRFSAIPWPAGRATRWSST